MSKLTKLYYFSLTNGKWIFFLLCCVFIFSFSFDEKDDKKLIKTIVIDPGHGGHDPGNLGTKRYKKTEKHIALEISLKAGKYIEEAFPDIKVLYTRKTNEQFMKLWERTEFANKNNADLFISVHCDGFHNSKVHGAGVYVMGMSKLKANMDIAMKENAVIYLEDDYKEKYEGFDPNSAESHIIFSLMQNTYMDQSLQIAENIENEFKSRVKRKSRGIKQAPFYVISHVNMPSILVEAGFLTNAKEEDFLHSEKGQNYIASAIFRAFRSYKNVIEGIDMDNEEKESNDSLKNINPINLELEEGIQEINNKDTSTVFFKVQLGTYLRSMRSDSLFSGLKIKEQKINNTYKYFTGNTRIKKIADEKKNEFQKKGFKGAFVVAFFEGNQISIKEALNLQTKQ